MTERKIGKPKRVEEPIHTAIFNLLCWQLPTRAVIHHSPNEFDQGGKGAMILVQRAKKLGMRPGWPDLEFILDGLTYFLEVKPPKKHPTEEQRKVHDELRAAGAMVEVVHGVDEALAVLRAWGVTRKQKGQ